MVLKANMPHILAVDDDDRIRRLLAQYLTKNGYLVITAEDAAQARDILKKYVFDICILDIMMPGETGLELAKYISVSHDIPILLLTAMTETQDRIAGLEVGVDDYLAKPFEPKELLLRIQAILRRTQKTAPVTHHMSENLKKIDCEHLSYDLDLKILTDNNTQKIISLTEGELALFDILVQKLNIPVRRQMLSAQLGLEANDRAVDVQVTRLRKKIEKDPANPKILLTLRGKGYMVRGQII